jgi:chromosome segregation ATPase
MVIDELDAKLEARQHALDRKIDEVEKHTTWRIKDCEDLLRSRINDTYVDDSIRMLEERLKKEMENITLGNTETFERGIRELTQRVKQCEDQIEEKASNLKKNIKEVEITITKRLEITKFDEFKKEILAKIDAQTEKIINVSRKCEPAIDQLNGGMTKVNEDIAQLRQQIKNLAGEIEGLTLELENTRNRVPTQITTTGPVVSGGIDKDELESYFSKYKIEINRLKETVRTLEELVHGKVDTSYFSMQISKKLDICEFEKMMNSLQCDSEKLKRLIQNNEALQSKIDKFEELIDKKIAKLKKDLDITNLMKQLKTKAEEDNVIKGFENSDKKINALSENLFALKKELEQALASLEKLSVSMYSYADNASLSTKKINPLACLSCGHNSKMANPLHSMVGADGKLYRTDANVASEDNLMSKVTYTFTQQGLVAQPKGRPQTATVRGTGKFFKNCTNVASPAAVPDYSNRPNSAKK